MSVNIVDASMRKKTNNLGTDQGSTGVFLLLQIFSDVVLLPSDVQPSGCESLSLIYHFICSSLMFR